MNELIEKLNKIYLPKVTSLPSGESKDISNFWEGLVKKYLPCKNTVLHWHKVLMQYIKYEDAVFAIRTFNNAHPQKYDTLRRGFLTATNRGYSYFYTDNFFAAYFQKMAMDNFVPAAADLVNALKLRKFPSRFGRNTSNERVLLAMPQGKDPRINDAGFKIAHILSVGRDYYYQGEMFSLTNIVSKYFPRGERDDWRLTVDSGNEYFLRKLEVEGVARKFLVAQFLRFVHPFNYFLSPQKKFEKNSVCIEIAEYKPLLDYAYDYNMRTYGDAFLEFLQLVMTDDISFRKSDGSKVINIEYGRGIQKSTVTRQKSASQASEKIKHSKSSSIRLSGSSSLELAIEYLTNPKTSFRKLESGMMGIASAARGGGFISKGILNEIGVTADKKGILALISIDEEILTASGQYLNVLVDIKKYNESTV